MNRRLVGVWALRIGLFGLLLLIGPALAPWLEPLLARVAALGPWAPIAFVAAYALATVLLVPGSLLTLASGLLFGVVQGALLAFAGASLGAAAAFLIARHSARGWVEKKLARRAFFARFDRALGEEGLRIAFLLRLAPVVPFVWLNYALGLTRVRFRDYLLASFGMVPGAFLYAYAGSAAGSLAALAGGEAPGGPGGWLLFALGLLAALAVAAVLGRIAGRALGEAAENGNGQAGPEESEDG